MPTIPTENGEKEKSTSIYVIGHKLHSAYELTTHLVVDVDNLFCLAEIGDMAGVAGASAFEARPYTLRTKPGEDATTRLSVARVNGPNLKSAANDAN